MGSGEGPFFIAKEFAFQQIVRNCGTVDCYKFCPPTGGGLVQALGQNFLSSTAFAQEHDSGIAVSNLFDRAANAQHLRIAGYHA
jgi:hypothetical protein